MLLSSALCPMIRFAALNIVACCGKHRLGSTGKAKPPFLCPKFIRPKEISGVDS